MHAHSNGCGEATRHARHTLPCRASECSPYGCEPLCTHACTSWLPTAAQDNRSTILIGFLVPLTDNDKALITDAAALAVKRINNDSSLLHASHLESVFAEADCSAPAALASLSKLLEEGPLAAVIGPGCSVACEATGFLTAGRDLPQISYGCLSPSLTDKDAYPTVCVDGFLLASRSASIRKPPAVCSLLGLPPRMSAGDVLSPPSCAGFIRLGVI
jgi:ABC-type branched-subunit amino acid transport system substrate-binding protein